MQIFDSYFPNFLNYGTIQNLRYDLNSHVQPIEILYANWRGVVSVPIGVGLTGRCWKITDKYLKNDWEHFLSLTYVIFVPCFHCRILLWRSIIQPSYAFEPTYHNSDDFGSFQTTFGLETIFQWFVGVLIDTSTILCREFNLAHVLTDVINLRCLYTK